MNSLWFATAALLCQVEVATPPTTAQPVDIQLCVVSLIAEAQVSASAPGPLADVKVREGAAVQKNQELAQIDAGKAERSLAVARRQLDAARKAASSDIDVRYARAAAQVAAAELANSEEAENKVDGTVSQTELRRLRLEKRRAELQIEQNVREAEVEAAEHDVETHKIRSPLDGIVVRVLRHEGEWVNPADPVFHVVRVDKLRVEGFVDNEQLLPEEVAHRHVEVVVYFKGGRKERFAGQIEFVSPLVDASGQYRVWAEVPNRTRGGHWMLRPGMSVTMRILPPAELADRS